MPGSTPNLNLFKPDPESSMALVNTNLNDNWTKIEAIDSIPSVSGIVLPNSTTYTLGQQIWMPDMGTDGEAFSVSGGAYMCLDNSDTVWGTIWRPLTRMWTPWQTIPTAVLPANRVLPSLSPCQYRISIHGEWEFRGSIQVASGTFTPAAYGDAVLISRPIPPNCRPAQSVTKITPITPFNSDNAGRPVMGALGVANQNTYGVYHAWWNNGSTTAANLIWLDGFSFQMESHQ